MPAQRLFLFGDQTGEILPSFQDLARSATSSQTLGNFLHLCTEEIRNAVISAPVRYQEDVPQFASVLELAACVEQTKHARLALNTALLCVAQFGHVILHLDAHPTALQASEDRPAVVGVCTGLLTAAAICCCNSLSEVISIAPKVVAVAFRVGLEVSRRSESIDVSIDHSWATVVSNIDFETARKAVSEYNTSRFTGESPRKAYISAQGAATITVSGPPATLADFLQRETDFENSKKIALPIQGAFHAKHLAPLPLDKILSTVGTELLELPVRHGLLLSSSTGDPYPGKTFSDVLPAVIADISQNMVSFEAINAGLALFLDPNTALCTFGPVTCAKTIKQSLQVRGIQCRDSAGPERPRALSEFTDNDVAIVGMAVRLPGSETLEEFWQVLEEGRDLHEKIRPDRFDVDTHCDPTGKTKNTTLTPYGVFIDRPGFFDARLFNMSPREAAQTDPQQRLMLLTTYEALEMSGYSPNRTPSTQTRRIGSWMGQTGDDWRDVNASQKVDTYFITGGIRAFGPGRLNYHFGWEGPSYSIDTACSSSAAAIQQGYSALLAGECDMAVGGGANFLSASDLFAGLSRGSFLSKTGGCKTFDHDADGYVRADAVGVVVMKRMKDAIADNDNVLAVLKAAVTNHSAEAISITHPHAATQERLFTSTLNKAGLSPLDIDYGELHGTGTQAGDATESRSVTNVLAKDRTASNPLYIGTAKPNLGHGEAGSGVTSLIKAILMMKYNMIPPHVGIKGRINQKLPNLKALNTHISFGKTPFYPRANGDGKRRILINNFDAAGGNTSMVIEDGPAKSPSSGDREDPRGHHLVVVSGKTPKAILGNVHRLMQQAKRAAPGFRLQDLAYTTTARRMHHVLRQAYPVSSLDGLVAALEKDVSDEPWMNKTVSRGPKPPVVFVFTGQGSQYAGMAAELFATHPTFRETVEECEQICVSKGAPSFLGLLKDGSAFDENMTRASPAQIQLAIVSIEVALAALWKSWGVSPTAVVGHSLGEFAALHVAGVLSLHDCLYIVSRRAALVEKRCTPGSHAMLAVQKTAQEAAELVQQRAGTDRCEVACLNSPSATVLSGPVESIRDLQKQLQSTGSKATMLQTQFAFHSAQMDPILEEYKALAKDVHFAKPAITFVSTLLGEVVADDGVVSPGYLARQTREPVQFSKALAATRALPELISGKPVIWVETGPSPVCLGFIRSLTQDGDLLLPSLKRGEADWKTVTGSVAKAYGAGLDIKWQEFHGPYESSLRLLDLPRYAFDLKNYWIQYEGDWALRKGDPSPAQVVSAQDVKTKEAPFSTTGLHRVESVVDNSTMTSVTFATEASEPKLNKALRGHLVNGAGLCPSSVYADMAFTAAKYLRNMTTKGVAEDEEISLDVRDMAVDKPLIIQPVDTKQIIRVTATLAKSSTQPIVEIKFSSQDGQQHHDHAHCTVAFGYGSSWKSGWARQAYLIKSRMDLLTASSGRGEAHRLLRPMVYKLFASFVDYTDKYQGMEEVHIDSGALEATASVRFRATNGGEDGSFTYSPYWIDGLTHLSGFVLNGTEATPADSVFISHGWESLRIVGELSAEKRYRSYVRMQPTEKPRVLAGDVYFFDGDEVVALCQGLKFQQVKRTVLNSLLPVSGTSAAVRAPAVPVTSKAAVVRPVPQPRPTKTRGADVVAKAPIPDSLGLIRSTIASEVGIDLVELTDDAIFADLGIDSLLSITITDQLGEKLGVPVPATLFQDCQNMMDLRAHFGQIHRTSSTDSMQLSGPGSSNESSDVDTETYSSSDSSTAMSTASMQTPCDGDEKLATAISSIIASEVGLDVAEIDKAAPLSDIGVDSLLTLSIMEAIKTQTGRTFPSSFLNDNPTLAAIEVTLCGSGPPPAAQLSKALGQIQQVDASPAAQQTKPSQARARLLQSGTSASSTEPALFLLPDGSGSASSYVGLPRLALPGAVYGLDSPFLGDPAAFSAQVSLQRAASLYVDEIRRVQPRGPYRLGGWSIGGSYAFEAAAQLLRDHGEVVGRLVLIDAPCPAVLPPLPLETVELLQEIGAFDGLADGKLRKKGREGGAAASSSALRQGVRQHFAGSIGALTHYHPRAIPSDKSAEMQVSVIWAQHGVWETVGSKVKAQWEGSRASGDGAGQEGTANAARDWIMDPRRSGCGPDGWDTLLPGANISCATVPGDHFGIMRGEGIVKLGREIAKAMA